MVVYAASSFLEALFVCFIVIPVAFLWGAALVEIIRHHQNGWAMAGWLLLIFILPIIGALLYFALRPTPEGTAEAAYLAHADQARQQAARPIGGTGMYPN
jgi:hypothetical protein